MSDLIREHGLSPSRASTRPRRGRSASSASRSSGEGWRLVNNDCVLGGRSRMDDDSVGLIVTSIPFSNHYEYTPTYNDFGHTDDNDHFWEQMDFLTPELLRVLKPGRVYALPRQGPDPASATSPAPASRPSRPFHAEAIMHGIAPRLRLPRDDHRRHRRRPGEQPDLPARLVRAVQGRHEDGRRLPGVHPAVPQAADRPHQGLRRRARSRRPRTTTRGRAGRSTRTPSGAPAATGCSRPKSWPRWAPTSCAGSSREQTLRTVYDYESHVAHRRGARRPRRAAVDVHGARARVACIPMVWHDVNRMRTLNGEQASRNVAQHVCPLQFDIVDRLIGRYSNAGELVFDPFGGSGRCRCAPWRSAAAGSPSS